MSYFLNVKDVSNLCKMFGIEWVRTSPSGVGLRRTRIALYEMESRFLSSGTSRRAIQRPGYQVLTPTSYNERYLTS